MNVDQGHWLFRDHCRPLDWLGKLLNILRMLLNYKWYFNFLQMHNCLSAVIIHYFGLKTAFFILFLISKLNCIWRNLKLDFNCIFSPTANKTNTPAPKSPNASKRATVNLSAMGFDPKSISIPSSPSSTADNSPVGSGRSARRRSMSINKGVVSTILSEPRDNFSCYITPDLLKKITKKDNLKDITSLAIHQPDQRVKVRS